MEVCGPKKGLVNGSWQPLTWKQLASGRSWPLVEATGEGWATSLGVPCPAPQPWRASPHGLLAGGQVPKPVLSVLVVMSSVPPEAGVGCMTPTLGETLKAAWKWEDLASEPLGFI